MAPSFSEKQKEFYDNKFNSFATSQMEATMAHFYFLKIQNIINENTVIKDHSKILEVGVGKGILMEKMVAHFNRCHFQGIDVSEKHVQWAQEKGLNVRIADASSFNLTDKFDFIYGTSILHHLDDAPQFLKKLSLMLNEGGSILFGAENVSCEVFYIIYLKLRGVWEIEKGMMKLSPKIIRDSLQEDYQDIKIYWHGNMFVYFSEILGKAYNALRLSRIPCLNDIYVYAKKK